MINTVSDLLLKFKDKEQELLKRYDIVKHPGIIGDMYEGLTKDILSKGIFAGLNLHVCAGKIRNTQNKLSGEIDCMVVVGEGEKIPYTDKYIYDSSKVIAVIQVKKNLFSKDIKDSFENLRSVIKVTEARNGEPYHSILLRDAWRLICRKELPARKDLEHLSKEEEMLYHSLLMETFYPARIIWGYNGFKSEFSLRQAFYKYLDKNLSKPNDKKFGFGPVSLPNLIICNKNSLIKMNGIPFAYPIDEDNWWPFYVSSFENPVYFLLEIIWTRLQYMFRITPSIFGDDLTVDEMHGFLICRYKEIENIKGWEYSHISISKQLLEKPLEHKDWEPSFLDYAQFIILSRLCKNESINCNENKDIESFVEKYGYTLDSFINSLKETGLVDTTNKILTLITKKCVCGITTDGKYFAGENRSGRVERWTLKQINKNAL